MTGQPTDDSSYQNDDNKVRAWDEKTRALAARLEALLAQHRTQEEGPAAPPTPDPKVPRR